MVGLKKITLNIRNKNFSLEVQQCKNIFSKLRGLMFRRRENASAMLFNFKNPVRIAIHSLFVFFPFVAIWIDSDGKIIEKKIVSPFHFRIYPGKNFTKIIEIPFNKKYSKIVDFVVEEKVYK